MVIEMTREELFKQIWDWPMTKVAAEYGISDVALKKICDKHPIPVPGRGYWAKKAAGNNLSLILRSFEALLRALFATLPKSPLAAQTA